MSIPTQTRRTAVPFAVACSVLAICTTPVHAANQRAENVLASLPFSANERKQILAGELVATSGREKTSDRELAITMAFLIRKPPPDLVAMFQKAAGYNSDKTVRGYGEMRADGGLADLQALRLQPNGDLRTDSFPVEEMSRR